MAVNRLTSSSDQKSAKGVALLMSLSIVLLMSIALMKSFEKRSLEVAHLGHNLDRFQAEALSRSGLKLILFSIKNAGLVTINAYLEQLKLVDFPVGNGTMKIQEITPVDYRFNLNKKITGEDDPRVTAFGNMVTGYKTSASEYNYLSGDSTIEALSAIIDWTDANDTRDEIFLYDSEQYPQEEPSFNVKNREFDRLTEVRLLPAFRNLGFSSDFLNQNFRVTPSAESKEFIDVNLTREADMETFLNRYEGVGGYPRISDSRQEIIRIIMAVRSGEAGNMPSGFSSVDPPFPAKDFSRTWADRLKSEGINLNDKEKALFSPNSNYLFIHYRIGVGRVTLNVKSMVSIDYFDLKKNLEIKGLSILWLRIT